MGGIDPEGGRRDHERERTRSCGHDAWDTANKEKETWLLPSLWDCNFHLMSSDFHTTNNGSLAMGLSSP